MKKNSILKKIVYWGYLDTEKVNAYQKIIRDNEWNAIEKFIEPGSKFLDVGCGSGYALLKAIKEKKCDAHGIDPQPNVFGVKFSNENLNIIQGSAEVIPFPNQAFDVVYSSHVIEHVDSIEKSLEEFNRVLKNQGKVIIVVPTSQSAWINLFSSMLFCSHLRLLRFLARPFIKSQRTKLKHVFFAYSHGKDEKTVFYDIKNYKIDVWKKLISKHFNITETILPFYYPFPDYIQLFKAHKNNKHGSSVAFICSKK